MIVNSGAPISAEDVDGWYSCTWELECAKDLDWTISGSHSVLNPTHPSFLMTFKREAPPPLRPAAPNPSTKHEGFSILSCTQPPVSPSPLQDHMDLDTSCNRNRAPIPNNVCRQCKQPGHWAKDCPHHFDIRACMVEGLEEALTHAREIEDIRAHQERSEDVAKEKEGFGMTSR